MNSILLKYQKELLKKKNVVAVGIGFKEKDGRRTGYAPSITISVEKKQPLSELKQKDIIPVTLDEMPTDVVETGLIKVFHTGRHRPAPGGVSIGNVDITAGTLGCLVKRQGEIFILSNNHVLACSNDAKLGSACIQPGNYDKGSYPDDHIAALTNFIPINMGGLMSTCPIGNGIGACFNFLFKLMGSHTRFNAVRIQEGDNLVDAAIARPIDLDWVSSKIMEIGSINGTVEAGLGMPIQKSGRTTGLTQGEVTQVDVTCKVQYGEGRIATFTDQFMAGAMSAGGDSGSAVLTEENNLCGLLFAGSDTCTIMNRIQNVFSLLNLTL